MSIKLQTRIHFEKYAAEWLLFVAICAVSTASIFIRFAQNDTNSLTIAWARMFISVVFLLPFLGKKAINDFRLLKKKYQRLIVISGIFLGLHFISWITSLETISIASSVVLVTTTPLWVALLSPLMLDEKPGKSFLLALGVAFLGIIIITFTGTNSGNTDLIKPTSPTYGYLLAIGGAWCATGYSIIGRKVRTAISIESYVFLVYAIASLILTTVKISIDRLALPSSSTWVWLVFLALIPQLLGHSLFNYSLRKIHASTAALALLGEPVGSTILGLLFLSEVPTRAEIVGGIFVILGILWGSRNLNNQSS